MDTIGAIGAIGIIIGLLVAFYGWKIHRFLLALSGFVIGGIFGGILGIATRIEGAPIAGFLLLGIFCAILALFLEKVFVAIMSGFTGAIMVADVTKEVVMTRTRYGFFPLIETHYNYPAIAITFIVCAIFGWFLYKAIWMLLTAGVGAIIVAYSSVAVGMSANYMLPVGALVFFSGAIFQAYHAGGLTKLVVDPRRQPQIIGTVFYFIAMLFYAVAYSLTHETIYSSLASGSLVFLLLALYVIYTLQKSEPPYLRYIYLLLGIMGLPFALVIGGLSFLYSYARFKEAT